MRRISRVVKAAAAGLLVLVAAAVFLPDERERALQGYVFLVGGVAILQLVDALRVAYPVLPSAFDKARRRPSESPERLPELARLEREVELGRANAFELHYRLRPRVREIVAYRLAASRAIDLEAQPQAARAALPANVWELVRPDREPPGDRFARGIRRGELRELVEALERL